MIAKEDLEKNEIYRIEFFTGEFVDAKWDGRVFRYDDSHLGSPGSGGVCDYGDLENIAISPESEMLPSSVLEAHIEAVKRATANRSEEATIKIPREGLEIGETYVVSHIPNESVEAVWDGQYFKSKIPLGLGQYMRYRLSYEDAKRISYTATLSPKNVAKKFDSGKPRLDLIPPEMMEAMGTILALGVEKYGEHNWRKGMKWSRQFGALQRHLWKWWNGENLDVESGKSHLWHAACCLSFLVAYESSNQGEDDRA